MYTVHRKLALDTTIITLHISEELESRATFMTTKKFLYQYSHFISVTCVQTMDNIVGAYPKTKDATQEK